MYEVLFGAYVLSIYLMPVLEMFMGCRSCTSLLTKLEATNEYAYKVTE